MKLNRKQYSINSFYVFLTSSCLAFSYELKNIEIIWAIKHSSISATFFDEGAAEFFKPMLMDGHKPEAGGQPAVSKRFRITVEKDSSTDGGDLIGCALGPQWASYADITGSLKVMNRIFVV